MKPFVINPSLSLRGSILLLGDKSIAHRALFLSAISRGKTIINNFPANDDCLNTLKALQDLGVSIIKSRLSGRGLSLTVVVTGLGLDGLRRPEKALFAGESGTTFRLLLGLLAGQEFLTRLNAGKSLSKRPMLRVTGPLRLMGAQIKARAVRRGAKYEEYPPAVIKGGCLRAISYKPAVVSAQVKGAILLAGLYANGLTSVSETAKSRDHTERMLRLFKAGVKVFGNKVVIKGRPRIVSPGRIILPGDISSAAFFVVMACLIPGSKILIKHVGLNPLRIGVLRVLKRMGARIQISGLRSQVLGGEPFGDLIVRNSALKGAAVSKKEIPSLIDELPVLMVAASFAKGRTVFEGVEELRVKETDRIRSMSINLRKMGASIAVVKKGNSERVIIEGRGGLKGASLSSFNDHRTALSMAVAGLAADTPSRIDDISCINKSFPDFIAKLRTLIG